MMTLPRTKIRPKKSFLLNVRTEKDLEIAIKKEVFLLHRSSILPLNIDEVNSNIDTVRHYLLAITGQFIRGYIAVVPSR